MHSCSVVDLDAAFPTSLPVPGRKCRSCGEAPCPTQHHSMIDLDAAFPISPPGIKRKSCGEASCPTPAHMKLSQAEELWRATL